MDTNLFIYHTIYCILDVIKVYLSLRFFVGFEKKEKNNWLLGMLLVSVLIALPVYFLPANKVSYSYLPIILLIMHMVVGIRSIKSLLITIITYVCLFELDFFVGALAKLFEEGPGMVIARDNLLCCIISSVVVFAGTMAAKHFDIAFYKKSFRNNKMFVGVEVFILFFNFTVMGTFFGILTENPSGNLRNVLLILAITLSLVLSIISLIFYSAIMNVKEYRTLHEMNQKIMESQKWHYHKLKSVDRETRKFRHDVKNHMLVLRRLLDAGDTAEAQKYMQEITDTVSSMNVGIQCGNGFIDAILNEKQEICQKDNISLEVHGVISAPLTIGDYDICTILANGIDNAIEAIVREKHKNAKIQIAFSLYQDFLRIVIRNPLRERVSLETSKKDKKKHGYGVENMRECVKRNLGEMKICQEKGIFELDILVKAFQMEIE